MAPTQTTQGIFGQLIQPTQPTHSCLVSGNYQVAVSCQMVVNTHTITFQVDTFTVHIMAIQEQMATYIGHTITPAIGSQTTAKYGRMSNGLTEFLLQR